MAELTLVEAVHVIAARDDDPLRDRQLQRAQVVVH